MNITFETNVSYVELDWKMCAHKTIYQWMNAHKYCTCANKTVEWTVTSQWRWIAMAIAIEILYCSFLYDAAHVIYVMHMHFTVCVSNDNRRQYLVLLWILCQNECYHMTSSNSKTDREKKPDCSVAWHLFNWISFNSSRCPFVCVFSLLHFILATRVVQELE